MADQKPTKLKKPKRKLKPVEVAEESSQYSDGDAFCPSCEKVVKGHKCRLCGATKCINQVSGNVIWMRNGRVVEAFEDERRAWIDMATRCRIPREQWPVKFQGAN